MHLICSFAVALLLVGGFTPVRAQQKPSPPRPKPQTVKIDDMITDTAATVQDTVPIDMFQGRPVYMYTQPMPIYPGGTVGLHLFLERHLRYPAGWLRSHVEGKVFVGFIVDREGRVQQPFIVKSLGQPGDEEALRVAHLLERFEPGRRNGQPVDVRYVVPVDFTIRTGSEWRRHRRTMHRTTPAR